jgi:hypothetical protein
VPWLVCRHRHSEMFEIALQTIVVLFTAASQASAWL